MRADLLFVFAFCATIACGPKVDAKGQPISKGRVRLRTVPKGARAWLNGKPEVVQTPATLILDPGTYQLAVQVRGGEALYTTVSVDAGDNRTLELKLPQPPKATLTVLSDVDGAEVRVNGYKRGTTPLLRAVTRPGALDITASGPATLARSARARLALAEQKIIQIRFGETTCRGALVEEVSALQSHPKPMGSVTIGAQPPATVMLESGKVLGKTPLIKHRLPAGRIKLLLRTDEGQEKVLDIEVQEDHNSVFRIQIPVGAE